ncbi:MAG: anaerobic selenocysteine-containing dehydrogenase [Alcanivorax sp.]|jgi:anaerobic selenocysteine-containing dehydrogenase
MSTEKKYVMCRSCHAHCGLIVDFKDGVPVATHGDKDNPAFAGFSCIKGRRLANHHTLPSRLLSSQKRAADGSYHDIHWQDAAAEMAERLQGIIAEHGPNSVAMYIGTFGYNNLNAHAFALALMDAIDSSMNFTAVTIDQPGKGIALSCHGPWLAGPYRVDEWDGLMLVGTNPVISMNGGLGMNPAKRLFDARKRGMELIVIDPRESESAKEADIFLQCRPGEDPLILGAIARIILEEERYNKDFVSSEVDGLDVLRATLAPFDPGKVAAHAGIDTQELVKAARMFSSWQRGSISVGTGPNMSGYGNATEYLNLVLTSLMGHWRKAEEVKQNGGVFIKPAPAIAASPGPMPAWGFGRKMRVRGLEESVSGLPTAALADEILTPGEGQIKALICMGGNPMLAWPDQIKTYEAMQALDLLVCLDPRMSKTCDLADYVIAPKLHYEVKGCTAAPELFGMFGAGWGFEGPYGQVSDPILNVPEGSDLCEEYEFIHRVATNMGKTLKVKSFALFGDPEEQAKQATAVPPGETPDPMAAWSVSLHGAPVSITEAFADPEAHRGKMFDRPPTVVKAKPADWQGKLDIGNPAMLAEMEEAAQRLNQPANVEDQEYPFRMIGRRMNEVLNSSWHEDPVQRKRVGHHPAFMHPDDLATLGLTDGQTVEIESERAMISCVATSASEVRPGCVAIPHSWGTSPNEKEDPLGEGGNTGRLSFNDRDFDRRTGIPRMSSIPIRVRAADG